MRRPINPLGHAEPADIAAPHCILDFQPRVEIREGGDLLPQGFQACILQLLNFRIAEQALPEYLGHFIYQDIPVPRLNLLVRKRILLRLRRDFRGHRLRLCRFRDRALRILPHRLLSPAPGKQASHQQYSHATQDHSLHNAPLRFFF